MIKMLVCDFDGTISGGDPDGIEKLKHHISQNFGLNFVVATGRTFASIKQALERENYPTPSTIVSDVGTCIQHSGEKTACQDWSNHVEHNWRREKVLDAIQPLSFLGKLSAENQSQYKITVEGQLNEAQYQKVRQSLKKAKLEVDLTYSHDWFLDITPKGVCKASAIRFLMNKHKLKAKEVCVAGDSANDKSMLSIKGVKGILVANHYPEIAHLQSAENIYTSRASHAEGVLEGLLHWQQSSR